MTGEAPPHLQSLHSCGQRHLVDASMTLLAGHAMSYVGAVIEEYKVRKIVHSSPVQPLACLETLSQGLEQGDILEQLRVAGHADITRGNAGEARLLDRCMAVTAIDSVIANMVLMTEGERLRGRRRKRLWVADTPTPGA